MSDKHLRPVTNGMIVDFARARADKLLRDKHFLFGCGHTGNRADAGGDALCPECEIIEIKAEYANELYKGPD